MRTVLAVVAAILVTALSASAQEKPIDINAGFGWTFPTTDLKNDFNAGWNGTVGVTYNVRPKAGIEVEYTYHHMNGPEKQLLVTPTAVAATGSTGLIESNHHIHSLTFDGVYKPWGDQHDRMVSAYAIGGLGYYHRTVELTSPSVGFTTICDPYWYVCYPGAVPIDQIVGSRSSNDFGINFGGGVFVGRTAKFYIEARYHYVWGPAVNPPAGTSVSVTTANGAYFPLTFGVRW
jgi:opacity protein-like surface antigen